MAVGVATIPGPGPRPERPGPGAGSFTDSGPAGTATRRGEPTPGWPPLAPHVDPSRGSPFQ